MYLLVPKRAIDKSGTLSSPQKGCFHPNIQRSSAPQQSLSWHGTPRLATLEACRITRFASVHSSSRRDSSSNPSQHVPFWPDEDDIAQTNGLLIITPLTTNDDTNTTTPLNNDTLSNYGTMNPEQSAEENGGHSARDPAPPPPKQADVSFGQRMHKRMTAEVDTKWGDVVLIGCFFCAGLIDSVAFNLYSCFVNMQTGNTIFIALGVSGLPANSPTFAWLKALTAVLSFLIGALAFSTYHRLLTPLKRLVQISSFTLQTILIATAAALVTTGVSSNTRTPVLEKERQATLKFNTSTSPSFPWLDLLPVSLLAFQSAGQVVASRVLKQSALPTVAITTLYTDLMADAHLLTLGIFEDPERNRRIASVLSLFLGAVLGSTMSKFGYSSGLWIAAGVKGVIVLAWVFWKEQETVVLEAVGENEV